MQERGWPAVAAGSHTLMSAPTGSGKTLAAFLWCVDRLMAAPPPPADERCRVLYISPLKALTVDVERNLRAPLRGIALEAERRGAQVSALAVAVRTGDTPAAGRRDIERHPPDILITTPESLFLMLTSAARQMLASVRYVIVDVFTSTPLAGNQLARQENCASRGNLAPAGRGKGLRRDCQYPGPPAVNRGQRGGEPGRKGRT